MEREIFSPLLGIVYLVVVELPERNAVRGRKREGPCGGGGGGRGGRGGRGGVDLIMNSSFFSFHSAYTRAWREREREKKRERI